MSNIKPSNELFLLQAGSLLRRGHLVSFPTETVYGLGANASSDKAVASVFEIKKRPATSPLVLLLADAKDAETYAVVDEKTNMLIRRFWPGALTIVLKKKENAPVSDLISGGMDTVALRVPSHPIAHSLLRSAACPVVATSANKSGSISPTTAMHVEEDFGNKIEMILDGGQCPVGIESTVLDMTGESPAILRLGVISAEDIESVIGDVFKNSSANKEPQKIRQYAPKLPLRLNATSAKGGEALLGFGNTPNATMNLSETEDLEEATANLFSMLHQIDKGDFIGIAVSPIPNEGLGKVINDRLEGATRKKEEPKKTAPEKPKTSEENNKTETNKQPEKKIEKKVLPQFGKNSAPAKK